MGKYSSLIILKCKGCGNLPMRRDAATIGWQVGCDKCGYHAVDETIEKVYARWNEEFGKKDESPKRVLATGWAAPCQIGKNPTRIFENEDSCDCKICGRHNKKECKPVKVEVTEVV